MNILTTGVRAMLLPFTGNDDQEQTLRSQKLAKLGVVEVLAPEDLQGDRFAQKIIRCLQTQQIPVQFDFGGVQNTAALLRNLAAKSQAA
jgi:predicted glycosyltransferase